MVEYVLQYKEIPVAREHTWQMDDAGSWIDINLPLEFGGANSPRTYDSIWGTIDNVIQTPNFLTRQWENLQVLQAITPPPGPPPPIGTLLYDLKWITTGKAWATGTAGSGSALNGRFTVRLRVKHQPIPPGLPDVVPPLYDAATVWIDNRQIEGRITGMGVIGGQAFSACEELSLSQFVNPGSPATRNNADIIGRAWDPVILDSYLTPPLGVPPIPNPNDNFGHYSLSFKKDGSVVYLNITPAGGVNTRVPNILREAPLAPLVEPLPPSPPDTGTLSAWDIVKALDAGPRPDAAAVAPYPKIFRGDRCAYLITLFVTDTTLVGESTTHHIEHDWPFCIMNDIPDDTVPLGTAADPWP